MTEFLVDGLEGRSLKATLRVYVCGLILLAPVGLLIALSYGAETLFQVTPVLVLVLVSIEYIVSYYKLGFRTRSWEAESLKTLSESFARNVWEDSSVAEAYRVRGTSVLLSSEDRPPKTILITSGRAGEGKTTTVVNTAISLAQLGASVLIIDCDLRKPSTHKVLGVDQARGLSTYLSGNADINDVIQKLPIANLSLLPCGPIPANPSEMISSAKMKQMLLTLAETYDHIIIDSPPLLTVTDPVILSTMVDGVILVVHGGKSTRDVVRQARQELSIAGARIFGVVLNNVYPHHKGPDSHYQTYPDFEQQSQNQRRLGSPL